MIRRITFSLTFFLGILATGVANAAATSGQPAPSFQATDSNGNDVSLDDFSGEYVVLEWLNPSCPFTGKHYDSGNMQALQKKYVKKGVKWLSVYTMPESGLLTRFFTKSSEKMNNWLEENEAAPTALLMDMDTSLGQLYGAKTTPHMFVINREGKVIYAGAIDDTRSTDVDDIPSSTNYVAAALDEALSGKPVTAAVTRPYGCAVKYN